MSASDHRPQPAGDSGDLGLALPLHGLRLIEASAGTGKTFTLVTVLLRLLLERGVPIQQLLAVTFTRAATQELRKRLRQRLLAAQKVLDGAAIRDDDSEANAAAAVIAQAGVSVDADTLRDRLRAALAQLDEALIATIHGFCQRALREFGFRAGLLADVELADSAPDAWDEVAAQLWRRAAGDDGDPAQYALLREVWSHPAALAKDLPKLCDPARTTLPRADESEAAAALHALRDDAQLRFAALMNLRGERTQDQLIEAVWRASADPAFSAALAERWPLLLIDEFQDTDPRQWDIFSRIHDASDPEQRLLCLIGDPKQAIYRFRGGDLATYLRARDRVRRLAGAGGAAGEYALDANYRSRPAVLQALETVFTAHAQPFRDPRIELHALRAAGSAADIDLRIDDANVPGLTLHWLPPPESDPVAGKRTAASKGMRNKNDELPLMCATAVAAIADLLAHATLHGEPLQPSDIAVLTRSHDEAQRMHRALAVAGLPAALLSKDGVFDSEAAGMLQTVLRALAEPGSPGLFRAALATPLLGFDAAAIEDFDSDTQRSACTIDDFDRAAALWRSRGPLPALLPFARQAAPRWLGEIGGARRLTDLLHLLELLQAEAPQHHGPAELLRWFATQADASTRENDSRQLRLEADAGLIQITTMHKAKGLEYAVVVLPFVARSSEAPPSSLKVYDFHLGAIGPARAWVAKALPASPDIDAKKLADDEDDAEAQRLLYVALTRAKYAIHAVWSRNGSTEDTALHWLLHDGARMGRKADTLDATGMRERLDALSATDSGITVQDIDLHALPAAITRDVAEIARRGSTHALLPQVRIAKRRFSTDLRLHSFSSLHARSDDGEVLRGADDEAVAIPDEEVEVISLGGTAFGNAVHAVLEVADAHAWRRDAEAQASLLEDRWPENQRSLLESALLRQGLAATPAHLAQTARLVSRALNVALPGDLQLCNLPAAQQVREMAFHFRLRPTRIDAVHALLQTHGYPRARRPAQATLDGLMQGYIDLVYRDTAGKHYVLDYKTNRLPGYDPANLRRAIRTQDYDLQYLIYLVALRRWLKLRHGDGYDDARHLGGAVYLFLRGIDLHAPSSEHTAVSRAGVHVDAVSPALLAALDRLFDGVRDGALPDDRS
jgi:exodeoxyribonuclease V beta subunit